MKLNEKKKEHMKKKITFYKIYEIIQKNNSNTG